MLINMRDRSRHISSSDENFTPHKLILFCRVEAEQSLCQEDNFSDDLVDDL